MKLAFIHTYDLVFVTTEDNAHAYALELKSLGHKIENIEIVALGSAVRIKTSSEVYDGHSVELDLDFLN